MLETSTASAVTPESSVAALPPGSCVAVLDFLGSFCPVTTAHTEAIITARSILIGKRAPINADGALTPYTACLGTLNVNSDSHVGAKLSRTGEQDEKLTSKQRLLLCSLATASEASWLRIGISAREWVASLRASFPSISFTIWMLNGADDVVRYKKWAWATNNEPHITMGCPGDTEAIRRAISEEGLASDAFVLGPDLPDISSTAARRALRQHDDWKLSLYLHPHVVTYLKESGPNSWRDGTSTASSRPTAPPCKRSHASDFVEPS